MKKSPQSLWDEGRQAEKNKKVGLAIELYKEAIKIKESKEEILSRDCRLLAKYYSYLGKAYERAGKKLEEAYRCHIKAGTLGKNRKYLRALNVCFKMGEYDKLESLYRKSANKIGMKKGKEHIFLGRLYYFKGENQKILREFEKKIKKVDQSYVFSLDIIYLKYLKEGEVCDELRKGFKDVDKSLVVTDRLSKVDEGYLIKDESGKKKYKINTTRDEINVYQLFNTGMEEDYLFSTNSDISDDLKNGNIPEEIKKGLDVNENKLSEDTSLKKEDHRWAITDDEEKYYIEKKWDSWTIHKELEKDYSYYDFYKKDLFIALKAINKISEDQENIKIIKKRYPRLVQVISKEFEGLENALLISKDKSYMKLKKFCKRTLSGKITESKNVQSEYSEEELEQIIDVLGETQKEEKTERPMNILRQKVRDLVSQKEYKKAREMIEEKDWTEKTKKSKETLKRLRRDLFFEEENYEKVLRITREINRKRKKLGRMGENTELNLIYLSDDMINGSFIVQNYYWLVENKTDFFFDEFKEGIEELIDEKLENFRKQENMKILDQVIEKTDVPSYGTKLGLSKKTDIKFYDFAQNNLFLGTLKEIVRDIENEYREKNDLPKIGKGWISEAHMVEYLEKKIDEQVISQGSPSWLDQQRYDAFIPDLSLAIEYQGRLHYEPIDYFGGEEGFEEVKKRDKRLKKE